ncbi:hypothetical protein GCM10023224_05020 [Streptomonospora halophila]|uniref:CHAP domain-containing protein n=1 Tax=Streptomonospora halophila TaxID=427369 RepID=A0ABP9G4T9_9ACTN
MPSAGRVYVDILPDSKRFGPELRSKLKATTKDLKVDVPVEADTRAALARLVGLEKAANRLDGRTVTVNVRTKQTGGPLAPPSTGGRGGSARGGGGQSFTGLSPAAGAGAAIGGPALVPAVGALTGALGGLVSGFSAATAGAGAFAAATVPAVLDVADVIQKEAAAAEGGKEATKAYEEALAGLTPQARNTVDAWGSLTDAYEQWQRGLQSDTLPVVNRSLGLLESQLPTLTPIVRSAADGFDELLESAEAGLGSPEWQRFTDFAARQAGPTIDSLGKSAGNLALTATGLVVSLEPLWNRVGPGFQNLTADMAAWANESSNFTGFIDWTIQNGPVFADTFGSIAGAAIDVGVAVAPLGTVYAKGLGQFAEAVSWVADTAPWLIQAAVAFGTARAAFSLFGRVNQGLIQPLRELPGRIRDMGDSFSSVTAPAGTATKATRGFRGALGGVVGALGGPWGLAITAGVTALGFFANAKADAAAKTSALTSAIEADSGAIGENTRQTVAMALEDEGLLEVSERLGIGIGEVTSAAVGQGDAMQRLNDKILDQINANERAYAQGELTYGQYSTARDDLVTLQEAINGQNTAVNEATAAYQREQEVQAAATEQQGMYNTSVGAGATKVRDLRTALDELTSANISAMQSEISFEEALDQATAGIQQNGATLNTNTEAGRANRRNLIQLRDSTLDHLESMRANGESSDAMRDAHERARKKLIQLARQSGFTKQEAKDLANEMLGFPKDIKTRIGVSASGSWSLQDMNSPNDPFSRYGRQGFGYGRAAGGPIYGPGTKTSDSIPIWASQGEYMQRASAVDYYGTGVMDALNEQRIPREALMPGFATGGWITRGGGDTPWDRVDDHRKDTRESYGRMLRRLIDSVGDEAADQFKQYAGGPMGVVRLANESIGKYPESGGNNVNAITSWYGMNGAPWCAMFISWLFAKAGASKALGGAARTAWTGDYYTSGMSRASYPQPGDVAVYGTRHVNLVTSPGGGRRVGGNQSDNVTAGRNYYGGTVFRPMWNRVGYRDGGLIDILRQDEQEDGRHPLLDYPQLAGLAGGGTARGWTVVGEQGPELARFDTSAQVYSTQESARMLAEAARAGSSGVQGGDGASSPLIGTYEQHLHNGEATFRNAFSEVNHGLRVARKGGVHSGG